MTYASLISDVTTYLEQVNPIVIAQIPRFLMLAENKLAQDYKGLGAQSVVTGNFVIGLASYPKPSYWREMISFNFTNAAGQRTEILPRTYEYCRNVNNTSTNGTPRYYADYNYQNFLVSPAPDSTYAFEMLYYPRLTPLDVNTATNWWTDNAPQALLYAVLREAQIMLKNWDKIPVYDGLIAQVMQALGREDLRHPQDRNVLVVNEP
jgi:hypothetical protein